MKLRELLLFKPYFEKKRLLKKTEFLSAEELRELQKLYLHRVLKHALINIPYYRDRISVGFAQYDIDPLDLIKKFPIIDKNIVRKQINQFVCGPKIRRLKATTGGSTGQLFVFYMDRFRTRQMEKAFIFDMWSRVGYKFGDPIFNLRGRTPQKDKFTYHDRLFNAYYASSFNLKLATIEKYVKAIDQIEPCYLHGYSSTMYQLASLMEKAGLRFRNALRAVFCGSEKLFPYQQELIEKVFSCRVYSWYGHSECLALGGECEHSRSLHFYPQYGYVEMIPTGIKNASGKEIYEIVATGFNNYVMPLIRYRTGDYAVLSDENKCSCGRNYLLVDEVVGREQEFVVDVQGELVSATLLIFGQHLPVFAGLDGLYLKQKKPGKITIFMKKNVAFNDDDFSEMKSNITDLLGDRFEVIYEFTDKIPRSSIGKARLVKRDLDINQFFHKIS
ncbi:MAG: phenylacetate--CoA ligase family protein [Deltaproteobacteria bacterium]|nr:phenylacetate--CoA ligase family protein [Deltaproteobacteria bacterium]